MSSCNNHPRFIVFPTLNGEDLTRLLNRSRPQASKSGLNHFRAPFFKSNNRFITVDFLCLEIPQGRDVIRSCCDFDMISHPITSTSHDYTFSPLIWRQIEFQPSKVPKSTEGKNPCQKENQLPSSNKLPCTLQQQFFGNPVTIGHQLTKFLVCLENE